MKLDMKQYLDVFLEESRDHIRSLNSRLLELEKNPRETSGLNEIFRSAHTLKGMSSTMGFDKLADLTHHMENLLADLKEGRMHVNSRVVDVLFECVDRLQIIIDNIESGGQFTQDNAELINALETIKAGYLETGAVAEPSSYPKALEQDASHKKSSDDKIIYNDYDITILKEAFRRNYNVQYLKIGVAPNSMMKAVRAFMVFKILEEAGEILKSFPPAQELDEGKYDDCFELIYICQGDTKAVIERVNKITEVKLLLSHSIDLSTLTVPDPVSASVLQLQSAKEQIYDQGKAPHVKQTVRVDIERLDNLMNLVGELVMYKGRLEQIGVSHKQAELNDTIEQIDRITTDLQSVVMKVRMVPIEQVFNRFPRMIRDLAKELDKEVEFYIEGKETELDRTVIDEIGDPLLHLLRNAIDHGLESPQERLTLGKSRQGKVYLRARHEGNNVYIEVEDDGAGIKTNKVRARAVEKGMISVLEAEQLSDAEIIMLLFVAGFSTATVVTDISGRGVGLDVVKSKIESLSGEIIVESRPGLGSRFRIKLPLTLAIIQALMVSVQHETYAIPLTSVDETTMIRPADIKMVQSQEFITLRGSILPLLRLSRLVELPEGAGDGKDIYVVVVRKGDKKIGLVVDTLIGQQEIVIKSLGKILTGIPGIAGAIIAGDGNVCLILDIGTLF